MDGEIYEASQDAIAIIEKLDQLNGTVQVAVLIIAALVGLVLGYLAISELLRMWLS